METIITLLDNVYGAGIVFLVTMAAVTRWIMSGADPRELARLTRFDTKQK